MNYDPPPIGPPYAGQAPPTQPYYPPQQPQRSSWPIAFGVIGIVLGGMGLLIYGFGAVGQAVLAQVAASDAEGTPTVFRGLQEWVAWNVGVSIAAGILAIVLLIAGIGLLGRNRWAVTLMLVWASAKIALTPVHVVVNYHTSKAQMTAMGEEIKAEMAEEAKKTGQSAPMADAAFDAGIKFGLIAGVGFWIMWLLSLPIVILIWFLRRKIRDEVAGWSQPPHPAMGNFGTP